MKLKDQIKELPTDPGVYHFVDEAGAVLYVGKAKNLKNRLKQYFLKELGRGPAIEAMVSLAAQIKWQVTESEIEAVLLEAEQIKDLKPKYNIRQKDDKSFLVIKISKRVRSSQSAVSGKSKNTENPPVGEVGQFPCVELVRFRNVDFSDKSAEYFGPYPSGELLKKSLRYLRKVFPFRDCSKTKFKTYQRKGRPCTYGDIYVCTGPCTGCVSVEDYERNVKFLKDFLRGKKSRVIKTLEKEMRVFSKQKKYEAAAVVRNQFLALKHINDVAIGVRDDLFDSSSVMFKRIECYDISNILDNYAVGSMVVFTGGKPDKDEYRKFKIKESGDRSPEIGARSDLERMEQVLMRRFKNDWPEPNLVIIDGGLTHLAIAKRVLKHYNLNIPAISISKGPRRDKNDFHYSDSLVAKYFGNNQAIKNIAISARDESHRFAAAYYRTLHGKDIYK